MKKIFKVWKNKNKQNRNQQLIKYLIKGKNWKCKC